VRVNTLRDHLERAGIALQSGPHPERAGLDAASLLLQLIGKDRAWLIAHPQNELSAENQDRYEGLIQRRRAGEPIQYITGETEFYGLPFRVTPDVLIPRPETEHLVENVLTLAPGFVAPRIADIGTGSGAIAVALAHSLPQSSISATDVSQAALAIACRNAVRNGVAGRIRFLQGNLLSPVDGEQLDFVVSNPPYVADADRDTLSVEVRDFEPALALFAGNDGLDIYRRLIPSAFASLAPRGYIALEIGCGQQPAIQQLLANAGFTNIRFHPDLQNIPRVAIAQRF
jgi:release factor glutamine methyltransferase